MGRDKSVRLAAIAVAAWLALAAGAGAQEAEAGAPSPIEGVWVTKLKSEITIAACPEGFCGVLSKIVVPEEIMQGEQGEAIAELKVEEYTDERNKDPNLRSRPILGLQILTMRPGKSPDIFDGDIYNPEDGNTYSGYIQVVDDSTLRLNGCVLFNIICRGEDWVRATEEASGPAD